MIEKITMILKKYNFIVNAVLFGSYATQKNHKLSDIDIAVEVSDYETIDLLTIGEIISELECDLNKKIDLVISNDLHNRSPLLAYNIYISHQILFINNKDKYDAFKLNALYSYMDFEHILKEQNKAFLKRIEHGTIAKTQTT